jgi:hypothetical protein
LQEEKGEEKLTEGREENKSWALSKACRSFWYTKGEYAFGVNKGGSGVF